MQSLQHVFIFQLPLTTLGEATDLKNSFYNCFSRAHPPLAALLTKWLKAGSNEGGRRHCTDKSIAWARCWAAAGGGRNGKQEPGQGAWSSESTYRWSWRDISSHSVNLKASQLRNLPQKIGITTSCTRLMGNAVQGHGPRKYGCFARLQSESTAWSYVIISLLKRDCHLWKAVAENANYTQTHTCTHPFMPWRASSNTRNTPKTSSCCLSLIA